MVILDGARRLRLLPGVIQILKEGPSVGVYAVCLDADERLLPAECRATVVVDPEGSLRVRQAGADPVDNVRPEYVTPAWCERLARGLAPLRDISGEEEAALPGSAFKDCVHLPHTAGMVTDLDACLVERALESISAELRRRERLLADVGAPDIEGYLLVAGANPGLPPLPRLLIVIDEFASLVRELPDFVTGLVDLARRGRSLGIHLILATQRPSGVVSPEIRANTDLRIALRVTDAAESADVIDAPDAARITKATPGRADLAVLVEAIGKATQALGIPAQPSPWLPALPEQPTLDELPAPAPTPGSASGGLAPVPYGLDDLPAQQQQRPACLDLTTFGHLFAIGGPRRGRSQILRTIAASIARIHSAADVHLYGIDCGNGALLALTELPHCGAVVRNTHTERALRLLRRLGGEMPRRIELLGESGFADVTEQRAAVPPHLVVLIDRWESFTISLGELDNGALTEEVQQHVTACAEHRDLPGAPLPLCREGFGKRRIGLPRGIRHHARRVLDRGGQGARELPQVAR